MVCLEPPKQISMNVLFYQYDVASEQILSFKTKVRESLLVMKTFKIYPGILSNINYCFNWMPLLVIMYWTKKWLFVYASFSSNSCISCSSLQTMVWDGMYGLSVNGWGWVYSMEYEANRGTSTNKLKTMIVAML